MSEDNTTSDLSRAHFIDVADPSWYPQVLRTLARDYPEISDTVWNDTISENAVRRTAERSS